MLTGIARIVNGGRVDRVVTPNLECTGSCRNVGALGERVVVEQWHRVVHGIAALVRWEGTERLRAHTWPTLNQDPHLRYLR